MAERDRDPRARFSLVEPWLPGCRVLPGRVAGLPGRCRVSAGLPGAAGCRGAAGCCRVLPGVLPGAAGCCQAVRTCVHFRVVVAGSSPGRRRVRLPGCRGQGSKPPHLLGPAAVRKDGPDSDSECDGLVVISTELLNLVERGIGFRGRQVALFAENARIETAP